MGRQSESKRRKDICIGCSEFKPIKAKKQCQNCWHKFKRKHQPEFYLRTRYTEIKQRCSNKNKENSNIYLGLEFCTRAEFLNRFLNDELFLSMFKRWVDSGWNSKLTPSIDRINPSKGYTIDNMQLLTHSENCLKDQTRQVVHVYSGDKLVCSFASQNEASRQLNIPQANIWKVINGERKTAGGFFFIGGEYENA